jgi:hypothetical protein
VPPFSLTIRDVVLPLVSAAVGYLASQLQLSRALGRERTKALNCLLYALLEIRLEVRSSDPRILINVIGAYVEKKYGAEGTATLARPEIREFLKQLTDFVISPNRGSMAQRYSTAVQAIVPFYPMAAHELAGPEIVQLDSRLTSYWENVRKLPMVDLDPRAQKTIKELEDGLLLRALEHAEVRLSDSLKLVSRLYPVLRRIEIARLLKKNDNVNIEKDFQLFAEQTLGGLAIESATPTKT